MVTSDASPLLELAVDAAEAAGARLCGWFGRAGAVETKSSSTDYVSEADRASEALLVERLRQARPDDPILGEEGGDYAGSSGLRWLVDPLDGTVNFLYGRIGWSVSVACTDGDGRLLGVVHDPLHGETFTAVRGQGAHRNGAAIRCNEPVALAQALIGTGFAYDRGARTAQGHLAARVVAAAGNLRRVGSAALDLCDVACGRLDAYYEDHLGEWDTAAGALIATEAGAQLSRFGQRGLVLAGPSLVDELHQLVLDDDGSA